MKTKRKPEDHLPLSVPVFQILLTLHDGQLHGYAIIVQVRDRTEGSVRLGAGTLYTALKRMMKAGMLEESQGPTGGGDSRRRYYKLTDYGRRVARAEAERLETCAEHARKKGLLSRLAKGNSDG